MTTEGRCLCGALQYRIEGPFLDMLHCHCSMCRKHHGTPFATWAAAPYASFSWIGDTSSLARYASSERGHRDFCRLCGSVAPIAEESFGMAIVPAGNLTGDPGIRPTKHMFTGSKAKWYTITDDLPQHEEYPPEFGMPATPRAAVETTPGLTQGSCLCGAVAYEIATAPMRMYYCHCSRCRQGRSAAHCANVFFDATGFRWTRGAELVQEFPLPGAQYFTTAFCRTCGSELPRVSFERNIAVVPAGSLDSEPGIEAAAHIFVGSKAPWFEITDDRPRCAEMPPRR
jgi:hypothetical protein